MPADVRGRNEVLQWLFAALALGLVVYGVTVLAAVASGAWFRDAPAAKL